jgi:hypothetical protein
MPTVDFTELRVYQLSNWQTRFGMLWDNGNRWPGTRWASN